MTAIQGSSVLVTVVGARCFRGKSPCTWRTLNFMKRVKQKKSKLQIFAN